MSNWIKASKKHKLGNVVTGLLGIVEGLIKIASLGNYNPRIVLDWTIYRRDRGFWCDNKKQSINTKQQNE